LQIGNDGWNEEVIEEQMSVIINKDEISLGGYQKNGSEQH
jgi:hypothetical protein